MESLKQVIMRRDDLTNAEVDEMIEEARKEIRAGCDPEAILYEMFGLGPYYTFDLIY